MASPVSSDVQQARSVRTQAHLSGAMLRTKRPARSAGLAVEAPPGRCRGAQARWQGGCHRPGVHESGCACLGRARQCACRGAGRRGRIGCASNPSGNTVVQRTWRRGQAKRSPTSQPHPAPRVPPWYIEGRRPLPDDTKIIRKLWTVPWPDMTVMPGTGGGGAAYGLPRVRGGTPCTFAPPAGGPDRIDTVLTGRGR